MASLKSRQLSFMQPCSALPRGGRRAHSSWFLAGRWRLTTPSGIQVLAACYGDLKQVLCRMENHVVIQLYCNCVIRAAQAVLWLKTCDLLPQTEKHGCALACFCPPR